MAAAGCEGRGRTRLLLALRQGVGGKRDLEAVETFLLMVKTKAGNG